jgi:hypothetical protein
VTTSSENTEERGEADPIVAEAVAAAMAATDYDQKQSWSDKILSALAIFSTLLSVLGFIGLIRVNQQEASARECLAKVQSAFQQEQTYRTVIAADDRAVLRNLIADATKAKTPAEKQAVIDKFNAANKANDERRAAIPVVVRPSCEADKTPYVVTPTLSPITVAPTTSISPGRHISKAPAVKPSATPTKGR